MVNFHENRVAFRKERRLLSLNPPLPVIDELSEMEMGIFQGIRNWALLVAIVLIAGCNVTPAHAENTWNPGKINIVYAVRAIIGEAENQGYEGMLAVAYAIRNRGTLKGVYGVHAKRVREHLYSDQVEDMAIKAWAEASCGLNDITHGATGWGNAKDGQEFAKCKWWKNCVIVFRYKDHFFYKEAA